MAHNNSTNPFLDGLLECNNGLTTPGCSLDDLFTPVPRARTSIIATTPRASVNNSSCVEIAEPTSLLEELMQRMKQQENTTGELLGRLEQLHLWQVEQQDQINEACHAIAVFQAEQQVGKSTKSAEVAKALAKKISTLQVNNIELAASLESIQNSAGATKIPATQFPQNRKKLQLPKYEGDYDASLFVRHVERIANCCQWDEDEKAAHVIAALKGKARSVLACLPSSSGMDSTSVLAALTAKFGGRLFKDIARSKLQERKQLRNETYSQLSLEMEKLVNHAYPEVDATTRETLATEAFMNAVWDGEVKLQLRLKAPATIQEAVHQAESVEACLRQARGGRVRQVLSTETVEAETRRQKKPHVPQEKIITPALPAESYSTAYRRDNQETGLQRPPQQPNAAWQKRGSYMPPHLWKQSDTRTCYRCGESGHMARFCRSNDEQTKNDYFEPRRNPISNDVRWPNNHQGNGKPSGSRDDVQLGY
jgi:zinc knuckle protein